MKEQDVFTFANEIWGWTLHKTEQIFTFITNVAAIENINFIF